MWQTAKYTLPAFLCRFALCAHDNPPRCSPSGRRLRSVDAPLSRWRSRAGGGHRRLILDHPVSGHCACPPRCCCSTGASHHPVGIGLLAALAVHLLLRSGTVANPIANRHQPSRQPKEAL